MNKVDPKYNLVALLSDLNSISVNHESDSKIIHQKIIVSTKSQNILILSRNNEF